MHAKMRQCRVQGQRLSIALSRIRFVANNLRCPACSAVPRSHTPSSGGVLPLSFRYCASDPRGTCCQSRVEADNCSCSDAVGVIPRIPCFLNKYRLRLTMLRRCNVDHVRSLLQMLDCGWKIGGHTYRHGCEKSSATGGHTCINTTGMLC